MTAFIALVHTDLLLYLRNRRALLMSLAAPILIGAFFGSLFNQREPQVQQVPVAVVDLDGSALSAQVLAALRADAALKLSTPDAATALDGVRRGSLRAVITVPAGFGNQALAALQGQADKPQLALAHDPSQNVVLPLLRGLLAQHVGQAVAQSAFGGAADGSGPRRSPDFAMPFTLQETSAVVQKHAGDGYDSYAHAFAGMGVQFVLLMAVDTGIALLLMRRTGLWQRLRAAPLSRLQLLGSRVASGALTGLGVFVVVFAVAIAVFGVRVQGSAVGLLAVMAATALCSATLGLMVAALGRSPEATRGLAILVTLLLVMLGGAWVPSFLFPPWLQAAAAWTPT
ncbi:MAG: ABC-2 transporter permease, partial [Burkholderiaceae bacterium]|nr:ABC-2 transporter permease [Burkholderiaceae bacterium]